MTLRNNQIRNIAFLVSLQCLSAPAMAQSLEQAVAETIASNPDIKSAYNEYQSKNELINAATGDYLPSLNLEAGAGYNDYKARTPSGDFEPRSATINIRQLIWDGSITYNNIQRNKSETEAQRYQLLSDTQDKALKTTTAYLDVLHAEDVVTLSEANLKAHQKMYVNIKKRTDSGIGSTADLDQITARLARSNANTLAAKHNLQDKITAFVRVVGSYPNDLVKPEVDSQYLPNSLQDALNEAYKNNPVMHVAANDIEAAEYQYSQAKGTFYPSFHVEASQQWGEDLNGVSGKTDEFKAMLKMNYNLFNGGSDAAKSRRAAYQINKSKDIRDRAHDMLDQGTHLAWNAMELAKERKQFLQQHVDASALTVIAYEKQFKIGKRTLLDVLNTENELFDARKSYLSAEYDGILAKYRVLNATGLLLNEMRVEIPASWAKSVK